MLIEKLVLLKNNYDIQKLQLWSEGNCTVFLHYFLINNDILLI